MAASIAQEFYKVREAWEKIDKSAYWKLAVWKAEYPDVDIIDKFMEIERSPIGVFDDVFFRFESAYPGDNNVFAELLWEEYLEWFEPVGKPGYDIMIALHEAKLLTENYKPDTTQPRTIENLWNEMLRFRSCIKDFKAHFLLYYPIMPLNKHDISSWYQEILPGVPKGIRLATMDFAKDKRLNIKDDNRQPKITSVTLDLNMSAAIKNEMMKGGMNHNTVDADARYRKQIIQVMETTKIPKNPATSKEIKIMVEICREIGTPQAMLGGYLIGAQAFYTIGEHKKSDAYIDKALAIAADKMEQDASYYQSWKMCIMIKASIHTAEKEYGQALELYERLADEATSRQDVYYVMEGRRYAAHIQYEKNRLDAAFEYLLLALAAGAYLDIETRRNSVFLHAAYLALDLAVSIRSAADVTTLKEQLEEWLGTDWAELLDQDGVSNVKLKGKKSLKIF